MSKSIFRTKTYIYLKTKHERENWRIVTHPSSFTEGLFGQIVNWVFEVLPKLYQNRIFPDWKITSLVYGIEPDFTVIPGIFDLSYEVKNTQTKKDIDFGVLGELFGSVLGNQWEALNKIWNAYFCLPLRITKQADAFGDMNNALGLHYRGTDKNTDSLQTNPVSHDDFLCLVDDFIGSHRDIDTIFVASDEYSIKQSIKENYKDKRVIGTGGAEFWKSKIKTNTFVKGDHAVLDCLLLSKCKYLIKNQSALSGFAKVFNPKLQAYRISASKLFCGYPYFPDAYIPQLTSEDPKCKVILRALLREDWTQNKVAYKKYGKPFIAMEKSLARTHALKVIIDQTAYALSLRFAAIDKRV
jgi:hypothetical protein